MGSSGVTEEEPKEQLSISELYDKVFPEYLAMGMTYRQFWQEDCRLVVAYRKAYRIRQEEANRAAWLNGLYMFKALQGAPMLVQGFIPKGTTIEPYPSSPIDFSIAKPKTAQEKLDDEMRLQSEKIKRGMEQFMVSFNAQRRKQELENIIDDCNGKE